MDGMLPIGPLMLPVAVLALIAGALLGDAIASRWLRKRLPDAHLPAGRILLAGVLASRAVFVLQNADAYLQAPLSILDIRDGGWVAPAGFAAAWLYAAWLARGQRTVAAAAAMGLAVASGIWLTAHAWSASQSSRLPTLPDLQVSNVQGASVALHQFSGKPLVINLWASWCPPCRREMPVFQDAQQRHADVQFVFLNQGETALTVQQYLAEHGLLLDNVLLDATSAASAAFSHRAMPATLFFDAQGRLVDTRLGELSRATLSPRLQRLTSTSSDSP